jgi:hypothetical protein
MTESYKNYFDAARQRALLKATEEKAELLAGNDPWGAYRTPIRRIERNMGAALGESFTDFLRERRKRKGKVFAMDVMGTGGFARNYPVDGEVAFTLVDPRTDAEKRADELLNIKFIEGHVLDGKKWAEAREFIKEHDNTQLPGFDLIICRPFGGLTVLIEQLSANNKEALLTEWLLVNLMVRHLSPEGGKLLVEMSGSVDYTNWVEQLQQVEGIEAVNNGKFVKITKSGRTYGKLPKITA